MKRPRSLSNKEVGLVYGFRSGLEEKVAQELESLGIPFEYEKHKLSYIIPATKHTYTPDFKLPNGIFIETKGRFLPDDRRKHTQVRQANPALDIRFVFTNPNTRLTKTSKTTYGAWCEKNGFLYAKGSIPREWLDEPAKQTQ